jgi:hypothetical protein
VLFYDATGSVIDVRQQLADPQSELSGRLEKLESPVPVDDRSYLRPRVHFVDSAAIEGEIGDDLAARLGRGPIRGYSLLIFDGWSAYIDQGHPVRHLRNGALAPGEPFATSTLAVHQVTWMTTWASLLGIPLLGGVSTATNGPISPATLAVEAALREYPNRRVCLYRSRLVCGTDEWRLQQRPKFFTNLLTLTGGNPGAPPWRPAAFQQKT